MVNDFTPKRHLSLILNMLNMLSLILNMLLLILKYLILISLDIIKLNRRKLFVVDDVSLGQDYPFARPMVDIGCLSETYFCYSV